MHIQIDRLESKTNRKQGVSKSNSFSSIVGCKLVKSLIHKTVKGFVIDSDIFGLEKYYKNNDFSSDLKALTVLFLVVILACAVEN